MIDTHSHIYLEDFDEDRAAVIERAKAIGIEHIILPNIDSESIDAVIKLEASDPQFFHAAMGMHPTSVKENYLEELETIKSELEKREFCAIGEIGIDLYWDKTHLKEQIIAFKTQLDWALAYQIPVIIHVRDAFPETLEIIEEYKNTDLCGVFHSFGGNKEQLQRILELHNFMFGINGVVTFKNSGLAETIQDIPLDKIILETDAPYLTPAPFRGKRNEPERLEIIKNKLSEIYKIEPEICAKKTTENSLRLFKKINFASKF